MEKMAKSKNNGVDPQTLVERYGADTVRLYTMFTSPPDQSLEWSDEGVEGSHRFIKRLWNLAAGHAERLRVFDARAAAPPYNEAQQAVRRELHNHLKKALFDYQRHQFNTVISACMSMINALYKRLGGESAAAIGREDTAILHEGLGLVLCLLAPIAPHITHYLWRELGYGEEILSARWPEVDESALVQETLQYIVQVNGKVRGKIWLPAAAQREQIEQMALGEEHVARFVAQGTLRKVIVVPGKLVNLVVG